MLQDSGGQINAHRLARLLATLQGMQNTTNTNVSIPASVAPLANSGGGSGGSGDGGGQADRAGSFMDYFFPVSDTISLGAGIAGKVINSLYKDKAAKQVARGNAAQHLAAALSTPNSQKVFGNPMGELAKVSADVGQANAAGSLAKGEAWQGSLQDVSNFISSINVMRRLMKGNAFGAYSLMAMQRLMNQGRR
jgi:hypothetical protein